MFVVLPGAGASAPAPIDLGEAGAFAVLGGQTVTNTGRSVINGDVGVSPGAAVTGVPPAIVNGTVHAADAVAGQAQADLTVAYDAAADRASDVNLTGQDLGGLTLAAGVYTFDTSARLTGTLALDAQGDPDAGFVLQIGSTLTTASDSTVALLNGAQACRVFWQIGSSATLGTDTTFVGNLLALTSITVVTGTTVDGRLLARNGAVTLDTNVVTRATCAADQTSTSPGGGGATAPTSSNSGGGPTATSPGGGGATTTPGAAGGGATTTPGAAGGGAITTIRATRIGAGATTTVPSSPGGGLTSRAGSATTTGVPTKVPGAEAVTGGATSRPGATGLARTGGSPPVRTLALGLLLLVPG